MVGASASVGKSKAKEMEDGLFAGSLGYWRNLFTLAQNLSWDWTKTVESICGRIREVSDKATLVSAFESDLCFLFMK